MNMPCGTAPVQLHDLLHELQSHPLAKPKPYADKGEELRPVPVLLELTTPDGAIVFTEVAPTAWRLAKHGDGFALVIASGIPLPVQVEREVAADAPAEVVPDGPRVIPELAHIDPAVFAPRIDRPAGFGCRDSVPDSKDGGAP